MEPVRSPIAIVDDDDDVRHALRRLVQALSYDVMDFASGEAFIASLESGSPSCLLLDLQMPGLQGLDVLNLLQVKKEPIPVVVITGLDRPGMREKCLQAGAMAYLVKPLRRAEISTAISSAVTRLDHSG